MSEFCKNKRSMIMAIGAFFLAMTILAGSVAYLFSGNAVNEPDESNTRSSDTQQGSSQPPASQTAADGESDNEDAAEEPGPDPEPEEDEAPPHYNVPGEMRGVFLTPGVDYITSADTSADTLKKEIDAAIATAKKFTMNAIIIDTTYGENVIYKSSGAPELSGDLDIMGYIVEKSREAGLYTYAIFDVSFYDKTKSGSAMLAVGGGGTGVGSLAANIREFAEKYELDGILIDGYINRQTPESYGMYAFLGSGIGYDNFMRQSPQALMTTASKTIRKHAKGTQIGLLADAVWENSSANEEGSVTMATFTSLSGGNADTRAFLTEGLVDFVAVKAFSATTDKAEPFETVVKWWADVSREAGVPMYAVHASGKICTDNAGWQEQDQLMRQVIAVNDMNGVSGSIFNDLSRLVADPKSVATTLVKYYNQEVEPEHILTQLEITKPTQTSYTTNEPVVTFVGASDPNSPVTINGDAIKTDTSGYFTVTLDLKGGENVFTISHKDKSINYKIVRDIEILKDISPMGSIAAEGGMSINITALAYEDANVYAVVNGTTVPMSIQEGVKDEADRDSSYETFSGQYTAPTATSEVQNLGNIVVHAEWDDTEKSIEGASVKVNKKAKIEDGVPIVVVAAQAMTYPPNTLDNIPDARFYPLPQGAMDYAVGDEIIYKKGSSEYAYFVLASGMRIESGDISTSSDYASGNTINGVNISSDGGYTYVTVKTAQKVSYSFAYGTEGVSVTFNNTNNASESVNVDSNAVFKSASWSNGNTLSLSFVKSGGFMGYKGYYDDGNLILRFNNPPNSISGARIAIDPGHGGKDVGALGFLADYPEKTINLAIAQMLADDLVSRGAKVMLLDTSGGMELKNRVREAEEFGADLFVSVHCNTAPNSKATGTEVYYFYPFAKNLASNTSANVSSRLGTANRGAKQSYYHVTISSQVPSVLVECGFLSNQAEYEKLIKSKNQKAIAAGIADSIAAGIKSASTGYVESAPVNNNSDDSDEKPVEIDDQKPIEIGAEDNVADEDASGAESGASVVRVKQVSLDYDSAIIYMGDSLRLAAEVLPSNAKNKSVTWKSGNTSVASVSSAGNVTAIAEGIAKITVTTDDGGLTAVCEVEVVVDDDGGYAEPSESSGYDNENVNAGKDNTKVEDIELNEDEIDLYADDTFTMKLYAYPSSAKDVTVKWYTTDSRVARVDSNGRVTAVSEGICDIIASVVDTDLEVSCNVRVTGTSTSSSAGQGIGLSGVTEFYFEEDVTLLVNKKATLKLSSDKGVIDNTKVRWKSSDSNIVSVNSGGIIQAKTKLGSVAITAYTDKDDLYATCYVSVTDKKESATSLILNKSDIMLAKGSTYRDLTATLSPSNATNKNIRWVSSNERIATVDANGVVKGINRGTCTIAAISEDNSRVRASCKVEVVNEVALDWVELDMDSIGIRLGEEDVLYVTMFPEISGVELVWETSNPNIVSVDQKGNIKGLKEGTAMIRVCAKNDSSVWDECEVGVYK